MTDDLDALEVAALRRLLHQGAAQVVGEDEVADLSAPEKVDVILDRLAGWDETIQAIRDDTLLWACFRGDSPDKRGRKITVMHHLIEKAETKRSGKTQIKSDTAAALTDASRRSARTYLDEMADEVPGCSLREGREVGDGKALQFDLTAFREAGSAAESFPPRQEQ